MEIVQNEPSHKPTVSLSALCQSDGRSASRLYRVAKRALSGIDSKIADLGCGRGEWLRLLESQGCGDLLGCDAFDYRDPLLGKIPFRLVDLNRSLPFTDRSFNAVTALEVIEHLENPRLLLREIHRVLKPGGRAIVSTPNNESLTSLLSLFARGHYSAFADACYPAHITPVLAVDMLRMAREAGFMRMEILWSNQGRMPGTAYHWQAKEQSLFRGRRFSDNYFLVADK